MTVVVLQGEAIWLQNLTYPGKVVVKIVYLACQEQETLSVCDY